jgi:DNA-binding MarR family transcriptional regulator
MKSVQSTDEDAVHGRRRRTLEIKQSLRAMSQQLALLNHRAGDQLDLRDVDLQCLDLIGRYGPLSPRALAQRSGLHPATLTGVLDRLEASRWIARRRDPDDRRGVLLHALRDRAAELTRKYLGMNARMDEICLGFDEAALEAIATFLKRTEEAGRRATEELEVQGM